MVRRVWRVGRVPGDHRAYTVSEPRRQWQHTRQRQCLRHGGSGWQHTRQRQCLSRRQWEQGKGRAFTSAGRSWRCTSGMPRRSCRWCLPPWPRTCSDDSRSRPAATGPGGPACCVLESLQEQCSHPAQGHTCGPKFLMNVTSDHGPSRRRDCHSAAAPSPSSWCSKMGVEGTSAK